MWTGTRTAVAYATATAAATATATATAALAVGERSVLTDVAMRWDGVKGLRTVSGAVLGDLAVVPGATGGATLRVRNDGPSDGVLTVSIVDAEIAGAAPDDRVVRDFTVNDVPAARLVAGPVEIHRATLDQGATVDVPVHYELPLDATSGHCAEIDEREVSFDVLLCITADSPTTSGTVVPDGAAGSIAATDRASLAAPWWLLMLAGGLVAAALVTKSAGRATPSADAVSGDGAGIGGSGAS